MPVTGRSNRSTAAKLLVGDGAVGDAGAAGNGAADAVAVELAAPVGEEESRVVGSGPGAPGVVELDEGGVERDVAVGVELADRAGCRARWSTDPVRLC
jgi:hypothetical protein